MGAKPTHPASLPDAVRLIGRERLCDGYIQVDRYRLRHRLFAGGMSPEIVREVAERGHAVAVLPYDPERDEVVLLEQFRAGPYACGDPPWLIEIVAGIIEPGEDAETVARREAVEEAGLALGEMLPVLDYYASPGALTERIAIYCARTQTAGAGGVHGLAEEGEDIRVLVLPYARALAGVAEGRVKASPAIIALQWLALNRDEVRRRWGAA